MIMQMFEALRLAAASRGYLRSVLLFTTRKLIAADVTNAVMIFWRRRPLLPAIFISYRTYAHKARRDVFCLFTLEAERGARCTLRVDDITPFLRSHAARHQFLGRDIPASRQADRARE